MRHSADFEHAARTALSLANVPPAQHAAIITTLHDRLDRPAALARRNRWIVEAYNIIGAGPADAEILRGAMHRFYAEAWPRLRHLSEPPQTDTPLRRAYFMACQAADDAGVGIPDLRQLRRIVKTDMQACECPSTSPTMKAPHTTGEIS